MKAGRRYLLVVLLAVLLCSPALAQPRIGVIMTGDVPYYRAMHQAFLTELKKQLPGDEQPEIILQRPFPDTIAWSNTARKLIAVDVDLMVTYGSPVTRAALDEKSRIPIIYAGVYDPGNAPVTGRSLTGCGYRVPLSSLLRYCKRLKKINSIAVVFSSLEEDTVRQYRELQDLAGPQGIRLTPVDIRRRADVAGLKTIRDSVVFVTGSALAHMWIGDIMTILNAGKIPAADIFPDIDEAGLLLTLYPPPEAQGKRAAVMAARVLRGENPRGVEPEVMRETELVFNLIAGNRLNITVPVRLIVEATRVIK